MIDNKLSLTFILPGRVPVSSQVCEENPTESVKNSKKSKKNKKKVVVEDLRPTKPASQHINMSTVAYHYMLNTPTSSKYNKKKGSKRVWDLMSEKERLNLHFDLLASDLHAISYSYEILED